MPLDQSAEVTTILDAIRAGDVQARDQLVNLVYGHLHQLAAGLLRRERAGHTLQPTALVHEALLRLLPAEALAQSQDRAQLFAAAARAMRRVLVDNARRRATEKRGGGRQRVALEEGVAAFDPQHIDLLALHDALDRLAALHERQSRVVELRFFGGCTVAEIAEQLQVAVATVESDFRKASAFLRRQLAEDA
jgi:RNA polymerase sigma factor (TIGR02999 family)